MTWANRITVLRILMIPLFIGLMIYYGNSVEDKNPRHWQWVLGCAIFIIASATDALDGFLARHFRQHTSLGTVLDPLADKLLLVSAIVLLTVNHGGIFEPLPLWFAVTVISRDLILAIGALIIQFMVGAVEVRPRIIGKIATFSQMAVVCWIMLKLPMNDALFAFGLWTAQIATITSGLWYIFDGVKQFGHHARAAADANDKK